jgi:hypothetical protein
MGLIRHPIVDSLANRAVLMHRSSPIHILTAATEVPAGRTFNQLVTPTAVLKSSDRAWGETDLASRKLEQTDKDERGPLNLGVVVTDRPSPESSHEPKPRLVLLSSPVMADNTFLVEEPTNLDMVMNAINWLRGQAELGGMAPKTLTSLTLAADPVLRTRLILVPTVMSVLLIIGLGMTTYLARRE